MMINPTRVTDYEYTKTSKFFARWAKCYAKLKTRAEAEISCVFRQRREENRRSKAGTELRRFLPRQPWVLSKGWAVSSSSSPKCLEPENVTNCRKCARWCIRDRRPRGIYSIGGATWNISSRIQLDVGHNGIQRIDIG